MYRFYIEDLLVSFPYQYVYPEQYEYMKELKHILDQEVIFDIHFSLYSLGSWNLGDANRNRQNCVFAVFDNILHQSQEAHFQADLLYPYYCRDGEDSRRA